MPTNTEIKANVDEFIIDPTSPQSVTRANVGGIIKSTVDYTDQEVAAIVQNNLLPSATKAASVDAVLAGLESANEYTDTSVAAALTSVYKFAGTWDASGGTFPTTGTGTEGAIVAGNVYRVSVGGTMGGEVYSVNDQFVALIDDPGQTAANWDRFNYNEDEATTEQLGLVKYASDSQVNAGTGTGLPNVTQVKEMIDNFTPAVDLGYKEYKAYFTQSGTSAPAVTVIKNTLGGTVNWIRETTGYYSGTLTGAFTTDKTFIANNRFTYEDQAGAASPKNIRIVRNSLNVISVQAFAGTTPADVGISGMSIEIYVYN